MNVNSSDTLNKILKMLGSLNKQELLLLNKAVGELSKTIIDQELAEASYSFNKGDIVSFMDKDIRRFGVVVKASKNSSNKNF